MSDHYIHIELTEMGLVKTELKNVSIGQALELLVEGLETLREQARREPAFAAGLLLPE